MSTETRRAVFVFAALAFLYLYGLAKSGMLGPDEPRYAAIGLEMARSGDWVTPRLWGDPWFEKPPLLYWTTAVATLAGLGPDLAPRVPIALAGFAFLIFFYFFVRSQIGPTEALYSTAILGTSAGWLAYSLVAVTDIPLSITFCAALLLSLAPLTTRRALITGVLLGLAMLAKGLVPLVLFVPVLWLYRRNLKLLLLVAGACVAVAAPWYTLVTLRNGRAFFDEFIWKHHFQRFATDQLQHVRPFWFYIPVLLAGVFPWTPLLALVRFRFRVDDRIQFLGLWTLYALVFFSASRNKLPGYILPLLPAVALLLGVSLAWSRRSRISLGFAALFVGLVPIALSILPQALVYGLSRSRFPQVDWMWLAAGVVAAFACLVLEFQDRRADAVILIAVALSITLFQAKAKLLPALDRSVSVRAFYTRHNAWLDNACLQDVNRDATYGLQYYARRKFPVCTGASGKPKIMGLGNRLILLD